MLGCGTFGVSLILFALSRNFWVSVFLLLPVGFTMMVQIASSNTLIQAMVPDQLRGRVIAVYSMMFMGMMPVGGLLGGFFANQVGAPLTVIAGGVVCIAGAVLFGLRLPVIRSEGRQLILAQTMAAGERPQAEAGELANP
jgi:MFS family permease